MPSSPRAASSLSLQLLKCTCTSFILASIVFILSLVFDLRLRSLLYPIVANLTILHHTISILYHPILIRIARKRRRGDITDISSRSAAASTKLCTICTYPLTLLWLAASIWHTIDFVLHRELVSRQVAIMFQLVFGWLATIMVGVVAVTCHLEENEAEHELSGVVYLP